MKKVYFILMLILCSGIFARAAYQPIAVTGFTADVIANGNGTAISSTTTDVDGVNFCLVAQNFFNTAAPPFFLPNNGTINSITTPGLQFQLADYASNNSLRLTATNAGTLTFNTPSTAGNIYLLMTTGSGSCTATVTINFTNSTTQVFTGLNIADWFNGTVISTQGIGRIDRNTNVFGGDASNPRLYEFVLPLSAGNYANLISSITVTKTSAAGILNVFGVSMLSPCTGTPIAGTTTASATNPCPGVAVNFGLTGGTSGVGYGYQWIRSTSINGSYTSLPGATNATYSATPTGTKCYRCVVTCLSSGGFDTSSPICVTVQPWSATGPCWCIPTYTNGGTTDNITNVSLGTLNNNTAASGNPSPFYVNYTSAQVGTGATLNIPNLYIGQNTTAFITYNTDPSQFGAIWIDYDHNGAFDVSEYVSPNTNAGGSGTHSIILNPPSGTTVPGVTRMRIRGADDAQMASTQPCGPTNSTFGETEDYLVNLLALTNHDPAVTSITAPSGNCFSANSTVSVQVTNFGSLTINLFANPVVCTLYVNGPSGIVPYYATLSTGILTGFAGNAVTANFFNVNLFNGGNYYLNTSLTIGNAGGVVNGSLSNDSLMNAINILNFRPTAGPDYPLCQYSSIPFGQGLTVSGCATPIQDSVTINFTITGPCTDNIGATGGGTSFGLPANCADQFACPFGNGIIPALPLGASFTGSGTLTVTHIATIGASFASEVRMNLYGSSPVGTNLYSPGLAGAVGTTNPNFNYSRPISAANLSAIFSGLSAGSTLNLGYWESFNDIPGGTDITLNATGLPSTASLKIYYQYVPASFEWYVAPVGGSSIYNLSPFNPLTTANSGITNSNTVGTTTFYAACQGSSACRVPVNLVINPTPIAIQDTLVACEYAVSSNAAIFDLTSMNSSVSNGNPLTNVEYYFDQSLAALIPTPTTDTSSTNFIYTKVIYSTTGCFASDSLLLEVATLPDFPSNVVSGFACAPNCIDVASLIPQFSTVPPGTDTLYYSNPLCTAIFPNPHCIQTADTVYMVFVTNSTVSCTDTAVAHINVIGATNQIANQDPLNFSIFGSVGCNVVSFTDGASDTLRTSIDCKRVAAVTDYVNGNALGSTSVCEDIDAGVPIYNNQPYVNRSYQITPTVNDSAYVCLYYLDDDFQQYNSQASISNYPSLPVASNPNTTTLCITQVENGPIGQPGSTAISIPNSVMNISYDAATTVWTVCFPVDSFSYFYCHSCNPFNFPLPVNLVFTGKPENGMAHLNWVTSSEQNNSHFVVERSRDGKVFNSISSKIWSQAPNGNSQTTLTYDYLDAMPNNGHNYYRLQQNDLDQHQSYSKIVDVYFGNESIVNLYPNPIHTNLNIDISTPYSTTAFVKIMDATGRTVRSISIQLLAGNNHSLVNMEGLADGVYMVHISNERGLNYSQSVRKN